MVSQEEQQESHEILKPIPKYPFRINARDTKKERPNGKHFGETLVTCGKPDHLGKNWIPNNFVRGKNFSPNKMCRLWKTGFRPNIPDLDVREKLGTYSDTWDRDM